MNWDKEMKSGVKGKKLSYRQVVAEKANISSRRNYMMLQRIQEVWREVDEQIVLDL